MALFEVGENSSGKALPADARLCTILKSKPHVLRAVFSPKLTREQFNRLPHAKPNVVSRNSASRRNTAKHERQVVLHRKRTLRVDVDKRQNLVLCGGTRKSKVCLCSLMRVCFRFWTVFLEGCRQVVQNPELQIHPCNQDAGRVFPGLKPLGYDSQGR